MTCQTSTSRFLRLALLFLLGGLLAVLLFYFFFDLLLPFTAAFVSAVLLSPISRRIGKRTRMSLRMLRLFLLFLLMALFSFLLIYGTIKLLDEAGAFFSTLYTKLDWLVEKLFALLEKLKTNSPATETLTTAITDAVQNAMSELSAKSASLAARFAAKLPAMLFSLLIFLLALFYFSFDYEAITAYLTSLFPQKIQPMLEKAKHRVLITAKCFFRAYGLLFLVTFAELYLAFLFLRVDHSFLLALIASTLDILPAVGVGVVLIPWAIIVFIGGNTTRALIILGITLAVTLIRQIAEPHIIGKHFGIHPLASLLALYVGFRLAGVLGILISPFLALAVSELLSFYRQKNQKNP